MSNHEKRFEVILSANVSHYYYTALELQKSCHLKRYICAIAIKKERNWFERYLPVYWQKKLIGRKMVDINPAVIKSIWLAELLQRGLPKLGLLSYAEANRLNDYLYDFIASYWIETCDVFHFVNGIGLYSASKAKSNGSLLVCDSRTVNLDFQQNILKEELTHIGLYAPSQIEVFNKKINDELLMTDYLIVPSTFAKKTFVYRGFNPESIFVLPYGVDLSQFRFVGEPKDEIQRDDVYRVVYVGQINFMKGVLYLIEAFKRLEVERAELLLVGRVDKLIRPFIEDAVKNNQRIRVVQELPKTELYRVYSSGSVFVLPSLSDSWGLVVLEAMACGLPVIVTENTGSNEAVDNGKNGFIIPIRDKDALRDKLLYLYNNSYIRREMGVAAQHAVENFTWEIYGRRLLAIYDQILKRHRNGKCL